MSDMKMLVVLASLAALFLAAPAAGQGMVTVGFYGEALCPDCINFINGPLTVAFKEVSSIFQLHYAPWGNAKIVDGKFECQHGEMECTMNTVQACALNYYPNITTFWPFLKCLAKDGEGMTPKTGERCAMNNSMDWQKIDSCYQGEEGRTLEMGYEKETRSLEPAQHYTPWVTINGEHDTRAEGVYLTHQICEAYKGTNRPRSCVH